jgi:hypothetical protein
MLDHELQYHSLKEELYPVLPNNIIIHLLLSIFTYKHTYKLLRNFKIIIYKLYKYYTANTTFLHIYIHPYKHTTTYHTIIFTNITYLQITQILDC